MALRGNLRDFSLPDVFQLVTFSRKTGVLRIKREDGAEGSVWFRDGEVFFASSNWHSELLGERLVKAQRITAQALAKALQVRESEPLEGRRLGQILIDEGYITDKVLESFVSDQIQDTIFDLMRWDEGDFDFEAMPDVVDEDIGLTVSIENVVMEGARRLEEWNRIRKKIPSVDVVFKMATAPGEGTFEISLKPIEWQLLLLIDGSRSVAELAEYTGRTDFEVARIVYGLFSAGLLEFASDEEIEKARAEREVREAKLAEIAAQRRAADEVARAEAMEREAKLQAEAQARAAASASQEQATADATAEAVAAIHAQPDEEPEFLGGGVAAPTADDARVLEEFMGAVLQQPAQAPSVPEAPLEPEAPAIPYVPVEEPAFMSAEHEEEPALPLIPVPSVEGLLEAEQIPGLVEPPTAIPVAEVAAVFEQVPEAEPVAPPADELSEELLGIVESLGAEEAAEQTETGFEELPVAEPPVVEPPVAAPPFVEAAEEQAGQDFERDLLALGLGELTAEPMSSADLEPLPVGEVAVDEFAALSQELAELTQPAVAFESAPAEQAAAVEPEMPDFSGLLQSLDVDAEQPVALADDMMSSPAEAGFDLELLRDEEPTPAAVISTDAFMEDINIGDLGFGGGLNDELSALTGAERRTPTRPQANVNAIPEEPASGIRRDSRVDRETVLAIIDGIKNL